MFVAYPTRKLIALALSLLLAGVACKDGGSSAPPDCIVASGGDGGPPGTGSEGGDGGDITLEIEYGGAGAISIEKSGSANAGFTPTTPPPIDLGPDGLTITGDVVVGLVTVGPPVDVIYAVIGDPSLYVSDGDPDIQDEPPVTGLAIESTGSLELPINDVGQVGAFFQIAHDVRNDGVITVDDYSAFLRGTIRLEMASYRGSGSVETFGLLPGQAGGAILVQLNGGSFYNSGRWSTTGADDPITDAGNGGQILVVTNPNLLTGFVENTGDMDARGGSVAGADGIGGNGGSIELVANEYVFNSGHLQTSGGHGIDLSGNAADISLSTLDEGDIRNTGDLEAMGGTATNADGGTGGEISMTTYGGEVRSSGTLTTSGGDAFAIDMDGGQGGPVVIETAPGQHPDPPTAPAGEIRLSGAIDTRGGSASGGNGVGGDGGEIELVIENSSTEGDQSILLRGYGQIVSRGGDGFGEGGDGADLLADVGSDVSATRTGPFVSQASLDVSGGDADPGGGATFGGDGGTIVIEAGSIDYREVDVSGGIGGIDGADGTVTPES